MIDPGTLPSLDRPVMIAAFEGWNDAGEAASGAVAHMCEAWDATDLTEMDPEDYYDYQVNRPHVAFDEHGERVITWPTTSFHVARLPLANRDVVLVCGIEPNMRWQKFAAEVINLARLLKVELVVSLGALLSDTPHTRPVVVTGTATNPEVASRFGLDASRYEGPTGIVGVLQDAFTRAGIPSVSFWASVPHYAAAPPSPKATVALLQHIEDILDMPVPLGELPDDAKSWEDGIDEMVQEDEDFAGHVRDLEEARDVSMTEVSGESIAREFERYLRRHGPDI